MDGYWSNGSGDEDYEPYMSFQAEDSDADFEVTGKVVTLENLMERLELKDEKGSENNDKDTVLEMVEGGSSNTDERWINLPGEVTVSIVTRLPFSSFCSFRCVCKKWNALVVYPDANLMIKGHPRRQVPLCVMYTGLNQFASWSPSSQSWQHLPISFGSSFGVLGFTCEETRVVAGSSGLLVLESLHKGLWVVNPINKTERCLPPLPPSETIEDRSPSFHVIRHRGSLRNVHIHLDEGHSSFKIFLVSDVIRSHWLLGLGEHEKPGWEIHIYNSTKDSWDSCHTCYNDPLQDSCQILSSVEFDGDICCLVLRVKRTPLGHFDKPCAIYVLEDYPNYDGNGEISTNFTTDILPQPPSKLRAGQLFVKDGNLFLGGAKFKEYPNVHNVHIWKLDNDRSEWNEVARMPVELMGELSYHFGPHVAIHGDYMWVTDFGLGISLGDTKMDLSLAGFGVMCHMPSDTWWKLSKCSDSSMLTSNPQHSEQQELYAEVCSYYSQTDHHGICPPFFFNPGMDLVV